VLALAALFACKLNTDLNQPVAIDIVLPDSGRVEMTDTFRPRARALNGFGDSVAAPIFWSSLDTAIIKVLDSTTGAALPESVGIGLLQARTGTLFSNPQSVRVLARPDSIRASGATRDTVKLTPDSTEVLDSLSAPLQVEVFAFGGAAGGRPVIYSATTFPASGPVVTLVPRDTVLTTSGDSTALASVRLRLRPGPRPDSVVVTATMRRLHGTIVPGSPKFVVEFGP
jgi:hypothetical protein